MKLSVVIVNYNVKYFLEQCLRSVRKAIGRVETEIIVVDNNSTDGSIEYLKPLFPEITFIANKDNEGFSKANNRAIRQATGEYILLLNPDTVVGEHTFENVCRFMDEHPDAGGLGVKMIDGNGYFLPESKRGFPSPWNAFCKMFGLSRIFPYSPLFARYHLRYLDKTGLLDEQFFMYGEDIDLSYRLTLAGFNNYYLPEKIIHYKGESTKKDVRYIKIFYGAMILFFKKHYPHYGYIYRFFIYSAIYLRAALSGLKKIVAPSSGKKSFEKFYPACFSTDETAYEEIIDKMEMLPGKKIRYYIYHPETNLLVSGDEVKINSTIHPL